VYFEQAVHCGSMFQMRRGIYTHIVEATSPVSANLAFQFHSRATCRLVGRGQCMRVRPYGESLLSEFSGSFVSPGLRESFFLFPLHYVEADKT